MFATFLRGTRLSTSWALECIASAMAIQALTVFLLGSLMRRSQRNFCSATPSPIQQLRLDARACRRPDWLIHPSLFTRRIMNFGSELRELYFYVTCPR